MSQLAYPISGPACPMNSFPCEELCYPPSWWLRCGYAPMTFDDGSTGWQKLCSREVSAACGRWLNPTEVATFYAQPVTRELLARLAATFEEFFQLTPAQWEADLRGALNPITSLYLWETTIDTFEHYTLDQESREPKKFPWKGRDDYLATLWLFFHHGPEAAGCTDRHFYSMKPQRAKHVATELARYFQRRTPCRR